MYAETRTAGERTTAKAHTYNHVADAHLAPWLAARFGLTVKQNDNYGYDAFMGDYDLDADCVTDEKTIFAAAVEFGSCYDGALFDRLCDIEAGEVA